MNLDIFPFAPKNKSVEEVINPYLGIKNYGFSPVSDLKTSQMRILIRDLVKYDSLDTAAEQKAGMKAIQQSLETIGMTGIRFARDPDVVFFYPKAKEAPNKKPEQLRSEQIKLMKEIGACLWWRFGKVQVPGQSDTYKNPAAPFGITDEHEKKDGMGPLPSEIFFRTNAKYMIVDAIHPKASKKSSKVQPGHLESDPSHSLTTMLAPMMVALNERYPYFAVIHLHGMAPRKDIPPNSKIVRLIGQNNFNGQFAQGTKSFPTLFAIAALNQDLGYRTLSFPTSLAGFTKLENGKTVPLTGDRNDPNPFFLRPGFSFNTNVLSKIVHGNTKPAVDSGRTFHVEFDPTFKNAYPNFRDALIEALKVTMQQWLRYDHSIHNIWRLNTREPAIFKDMRKYPEMFTDKYLLENKSKSAQSNALKSSTLLFSQTKAISPTVQEEHKVESTLKLK